MWQVAAGKEIDPDAGIDQDLLIVDGFGRGVGRVPGVKIPAYLRLSSTYTAPVPPS